VVAISSLESLVREVCFLRQLAFPLCKKAEPDERATDDIVSGLEPVNYLAPCRHMLPNEREESFLFVCEVLEQLIPQFGRQGREYFADVGVVGAHVGSKEVGQLQRQLAKMGVRVIETPERASGDHGRDIGYACAPVRVAPGGRAKSSTGRMVPSRRVVHRNDLGPVHTGGNGFRARAEGRQREYRANVLGAGYSRLGHLLDPEATRAGKNFILAEAHAAARTRASQGKGVADRTFSNMLSSQAMCFNLFAPLAANLSLATAVLAPFVPGVTSVRSIQIEYTPPEELFGDQSGRGGVDCDVLVETDWDDGQRGVVVLETKFVEPEFSSCGFRRSGRVAKGLPVCPVDVSVRSEPAACLYTSRKEYGYWARSNQFSTLARERLPAAGCPFGGPLWQLWVNHTLAHAVAAGRGARHARFAVCAPIGNEALLRGGVVLDEFRRILAEPTTFLMLPLDALLERVAGLAERERPLRPWSAGLMARYSRI